MRGILSDANVEGQCQVLLRIWQSARGQSVWEELGCASVSFADLGLDPDASDDEVWGRCQAESLVLVTGNRNRRGRDSLEAVIRSQSTSLSLPVITLAKPDRIRESGYALSVAESVLTILVEIDNYRGTGRLYVP